MPVSEAETERDPRYTMAGSRIAVVTDRLEDLVEVQPPSRGSVDPGGLTVEQCPPAPLPTR